MLMSNLLTMFANNINKLLIYSDLNANRFLDFNRQFPTFIDHVPFLNVRYISDLDSEILFNWLIKPLKNGSQQILRYHTKFNQSWNKRQEMELHLINRIKVVNINV